MSGVPGVSVSLVRPFVSIVVPCRNEAAYIGQMLDSMLANAYPRDRLEVLIVDGMSDDGTRSVVADYASRYPVVQLLDNPKRTTPAALNVGISRARGSIIMRMDAHATYPANYIVDLVDCMERTGADSVGASWRTEPGDTTIMARAIAAAVAHPFGWATPSTASARAGSGTSTRCSAAPTGATCSSGWGRSTKIC